MPFTTHDIRSCDVTQTDPSSEIQQSPPFIDPTNAADDLQTIAARINRHRDALNANLFEIGRDLQRAKHKLAGERAFTKWVLDHFDWSPSTAQRYMRAAKVWGGKEELVSCLDASSIYALTAKATPEHVRHEIEGELSEKERPTVQEIRERIKAAKDEIADEKQPDRKARAREAAALIRAHIEDVDVKLRGLLQGADRTEFIKALMEAPRGADQAERRGLGLP